MNNLKTIVELSRQVDQGFAKHHRRPWSVEAWFVELSKQVGELAKFIMMYERYYPAAREQLPVYAASKESIGNELADIVHSVVMIAEHYGLDLEQCILDARAEELEHLKQLETRNRDA
jgi:NTP pyrophosphatase (non-canonical NTP hydrolase)